MKLSQQQISETDCDYAYELQDTIYNASMDDLLCSRAISWKKTKTTKEKKKCLYQHGLKPMNFNGLIWLNYLKRFIIL